MRIVLPCSRGCFNFTTPSGNYNNLPVPVCQHHHDVQRCQEVNEMKEGVAICHTLFLIIYYLLSFLLITCNEKNYMLKYKIKLKLYFIASKEFRHGSVVVNT